MGDCIVVLLYMYILYPRLYNTGLPCTGISPSSLCMQWVCVLVMIQPFRSRNRHLNSNMLQTKEPKLQHASDKAYSIITCTSSYLSFSPLMVALRLLTKIKRGWVLKTGCYKNSENGYTPKKECPCESRYKCTFYCTPWLFFLWNTPILANSVRISMGWVKKPIHSDVYGITYRSSLTG
jgi:hypothetical protein